MAPTIDMALQIAIHTRTSGPYRTQIFVVIKNFTFSACPGRVRGELAGQRPAGAPFEEAVAVETLRSLWQFTSVTCPKEIWMGLEPTY